MIARDYEKDALETFKGTTRLLIALATGGLVLIPTLAGLRRDQIIDHAYLLYIAVLLLLGSILAGLFVLSSLAGTQRENIYDTMVSQTRRPGLIQWFLFPLGLGCLVTWAFLVIFSSPGQVAQKGENVISAFSILFDFDSAAVSPAAILQIEGTLRQARRLGFDRIIVVGHADAVGSVEYNLSLSRRRAESMKEVLIRLGVGSNEIEISGAGSTLPMLSNRTREGRQLNRRVEVRIASTTE